MKFEGVSAMDLTFAAVQIREFKGECQIRGLPRWDANVEIGRLANAGSMLSCRI
jgi:hypothetical protein